MFLHHFRSPWGRFLIEFADSESSPIDSENFPAGSESFLFPGVLFRESSLMLPILLAGTNAQAPRHFRALCPCNFLCVPGACLST